jgi:hypothetical protein
MLGTLYRYPHPYKSDAFIYVGQGPKRDKSHRSALSSFGKRFRKEFPGIALPQPIREKIEVQDYLELNELETIWMFQYHTWYGYDGGMNLRLPEDKNYKNIAQMGGRVGGRKTLESGKLYKFSTSDSIKGGKASGPVNGRSGGRIGGRRNVESGHLARLRNPEHQAAAARSQTHKRFHEDRNRANPRCVLCSERNLIVAFS